MSLVIQSTDISQKGSDRWWPHKSIWILFSISDFIKIKLFPALKITMGGLHVVNYLSMSNENLNDP